MSKMSEISASIEELRRCAVVISETADWLSELFGGKPEETAPTTPAPEPEKPKVPTLTLEKVRAALAQKSRDRYTEQIRSLLQKYGSDKLSGIDPKDYAALMADAEGLEYAT